MFVFTGIELVAERTSLLISLLDRRNIYWLMLILPSLIIKKETLPKETSSLGLMLDLITTSTDETEMKEFLLS